MSTFPMQKSNPILTGLGIGIAIGAILGSVLKSVPLMFFFMIMGAIIGARIGSKYQKAKKAKKEDVIDIGFLKPRFTVWNAIFMGILIIALVFFRPWFHGAIISLYKNPIVFILFLAIAAAMIFASKRIPIATTISVAVIILTIIVLLFSPLIIQRYIVTSTQYNKIDKLPDTTEVRILPKAVAWRYMGDSLQKSREKIGGLDIVRLNESFVWTAPRIPDGPILYLTENVKGLMVADATKSDRSTSLVTEDMKIGEGIGITDDIFWKLYKREYLMDIDEIYYVMDGDDVLSIAPIIRYKFKFPVMVPYFAGVYIVEPEGSLKFYKPEEAAKIPYLKNNWAYPESLARLYVDSYKYNLGIINAWFLHKDQIEISDVYGQANRQPFLIPTDEGLKWFIATEPYGESYGVFKIFVVDGLTGKIDMLELDEDQTLTGPVKVTSYVRKAFPIIDWSRSSIIEPRPYVVDGTLYWMLSITPIDFAGISYTIFVNSENNEIISFKQDDDVYKFVNEGIVKGDVKQEEMPGMETTADQTIEENEVLQKIAEIERNLEELKQLIE